MDRAAYEGMSAIEDHHWWFVARRLIIDTLISNGGALQPGARILEAGCGTGGNLALLSSYGELHAFEFDADAREMARGKGICPVNFGALPDRVDTDGAPYNLIALLDVLEHIDDDAASLATLGGLLAPRGKLLVTVPAIPMLWSSHDELHHHKRRYTRSTLQQAFACAGLEVERIGYFNSLLFPLAFAQRLLAKLLHRKEAVDTLPSPFVNSALKAIFAAERHLLGRISFPIGLSLYAIARRPG